MMILVIAFSSMQIMAQGKKMNKKGPAFKDLELTENQQAKAKTLRMDLQQKSKLMNLDIKEKQIQLEKLMIADEPDKNAIFKKIDEISKLKTELQKLKATHRLDFRAMLTPEQQLKFDTHQMNKRKRIDNPDKGKKIQAKR